VWGGAWATAYPWGWQHSARSVNLQVAQAFGPSNLVNNVQAESARGCNGCDALAVNFQVDLVSYTNTPPNETDVASVINYGNNDTNLAAAAMFVVTSPGLLSLSGSGWAQIGNIEWQVRSLSLQGSTSAAVQGEINALTGQVLQILESDVTTYVTPAFTPGVGTPAVSPAVGTPAVTPAVAPAVTTPSSGIQITSNVQFGS
jgi:hypothetical protein